MTLQKQDMQNELLQKDVAQLCSMPTPQDAPRPTTGDPPLVMNIHLRDQSEEIKEHMDQSHAPLEPRVHLADDLLRA